MFLSLNMNCKDALTEYIAIKNFLTKNSLTRLNPNFKLEDETLEQEQVQAAVPKFEMGSWGIKSKKVKKTSVLQRKFVQMIEINTILKIIEEYQQKFELLKYLYQNDYNVHSYSNSFSNDKMSC